jgi:adenosylcobinamide-GDP ribazoletransferase
MNWDALSGALAFLTILPARHLRDDPGRIFAWFPAVGLVIGCLLAALAANEVLSPPVRALTVLVGWIVITGGLHLDGLGDFCDGVLATTTPERRLEIMKDPRSGMWAVVGLVVVLLAKWVLIQDVAPFALLVPPILGRWGMTLAAYAFPYGRATGGIGGYFRHGLTQRDVLLATLQAGIFVLPAMLLFGAAVTLAFVLTPLLVWLLGHWAAARLGGGLTGDVYGALCELTELLCLFVLAT